jgi:hypothetical protein
MACISQRTGPMTGVTARLAEHERRLGQHDADIRQIYREIKELRREMRQGFRSVRQEVGWLRRAMVGVMAHMGVEAPGDEEE